jgi:hypothetical protein
MAQYERGSTAELVVLWTDFPGGSPVAVTSPEIQINILGGATLVGPTGVGVTNPELGYYAYSYAIPALADTGLYEVIWTGVNDDMDQVTSYATFEVVEVPEVVDGGDGCERMEFFNKHWWYADGSIAPGVRVAVYEEDQNTLVPIFSDVGLTTPLANPSVTDGAGLFTFYAAEGTYWVVAGDVHWADSVCVTIGPDPGDLFQPLATIDAKGDLYAGIGPDSTTRLGVGADGEVLTADSAEPTGMKWAPGGGGGGGIPESIIDAKGDLIAGSAPDTAVRLPVGTNGQVLSANSATGTGLQWIPAPGGAVDSVNGQTGVVVLTASDVGAPPTSRNINTTNGLTGGGSLAADRTIEPVYGTTANTVAEGDDTRIVNAIQQTLVDAKGDLIAATADNVVTRLPVGTNGQVLAANSGMATGLEWIPAPGGAVDSVNGQTGVVVLTASDVGAQPIATIDAKGDLYAGTGDNATTRQAVGTNGQVLRANSATGTGLEWDTLDAADVGAVPTSRQVLTTNGLTGGGDLSADRTLEPVYGTTANTVAEGDDTRIVNAIQVTIIDAKGDLIAGSAADTAVRVPVGTNGFVLKANSATTPGVEWASLGISVPSINFNDDRPVITTGNGVARWYNRGPALTIVGVWVSAGVVPTGADIIVDVNINGTTIYSTQANRPTVPATTNGGAISATPNTTAVAVGDYFTVDIDQIGSTIPGGRIVVGIVVNQSL